MPARLGAAVVIALSLASCQAAGPGERAGTHSDGQARKSGTGELRSDLDPLLTRFPLLGTPESVRWMSGTYGDPDTPGPSTYWIDAVVKLTHTKATQLTTAYAPVAGDSKPEVVDGMAAHLPAGPFSTSPALDAAFKRDRWSASVYVDPRTDELVIVATGE
ncbi:hypothetical protein [Actinokineospora sp. NBRC 105648]|uniref:hypothetical protein n=1 Tax=Actinokineospora sp. NBRC 105648 TaxID=3032206 RepID=UPI002555F5F4|nr:hypothetical protein [Actinokineospora sp. NBRC 105648]